MHARRSDFACLQPARQPRLSGIVDQPEDATATRVIDLDPARNRTGDVWHVWIEGIRHGQLYAYRVGRPYQPKDGHRFNFNKLLLGPLRRSDIEVAHLGVRSGSGI